MAFTSSHTPWELGTPGIDPAYATSDPPFVCMQDIIDHENALVESIPDEERAALMPIIRFVRNTLQDPFTALHHCWAMDALKLADTAQMQIHDKHHIDTTYRFHKEVDVLEKRELQGPHLEDAVGACGVSMPCICGPKRINDSHCLESCKVSTPRESITSRYSSQNLYQQKTCQDALHQKEAQNFVSLQVRNYQSHYSKHDNQTNPIHQHRGGFSLSSSTYTGLGESVSKTFEIDSQSNFTNICSNLDMDSFNLEELRSRLRPPALDMDSNGNGIQTVDISNCSDGVHGEDEEMHGKDGNNHSYLYYPNQDEEQDESDVEWPLYWGNNMHPHQTTTADDNFRFPKVHCRRRNVTKRATGWIKTRAAQFLVSRVRHKRKCNLPCCTDCEMGTKRRKASGSGSRKCAKLSLTTQIASSSTATPSENAAQSNRVSSRTKTAYFDMTSSESCDDKEASQVTQDSGNSPLATELAIVLMNSKGCGLTSCEALQALVQKGYLKANKNEHQAMASHVKTTLKKSPLFKELKNHRFILKAGQKLASSNLHGTIHDQKFSERELRPSQVLYSGKRERSLSQIVDQRVSILTCQQPCQQDIRCHTTDRNRPGFLCDVQHLQLRAATSTSGCSSCEVIDACDASNERRQGVNQEDMLASIIDSCLRQNEEDKEHNQDQVEPMRCCRTDGKSWQCSNQAQEGSTYCEHHQSRSKKGMVKQHVPELKKMGKLKIKELTAKNQCANAQGQRLSMQLRPRSGAARDTCLHKL